LGVLPDDNDPPPAATGTRRVLLQALGWSCVALGLVGAVLPLLPTTPFLLVALWAFAGSSRRFHDWLYTHRLFGPPLQAWQAHGVIPLKAKVLALCAMVASMTYVIVFATVPWWGIMGMGAMIGFGAGFILACPSRPRSSDLNL
jgi:uncharacterized membrane protein YbaN (DUF454 family)